MLIDPRIASAFESQCGFPLEPHLVVLARMGSHSHGTYIAPAEPDGLDDLDLMGFVVPPLEYHLGLPHWENWVLRFEELDVVLYSLQKAFRLLLNSNPNVVGMLWLREEEYGFRHPLFARLLAARSIFSAKSSAAAFSGYAFNQVQRMEAFDLKRIAEYEALTLSIREHCDPREVIEADASKLDHISSKFGLRKETLQRFRNLHRGHFSGYMGEKRKAMVRKYSYDVKMAAHVIRLLRMGVEFLETGTLTVYRTADADELREIKRGAWPLEKVKAEAEVWFARLDEAKSRSPLPELPDEPAANRLLIELHRAIIGV